MKCQKLMQGESIYTNSLKIVKHIQGRATGYWKGITSTEAQKFTYHVGISSTEQESSKNSSVNKLGSSLESGWSASGSMSAGAYGVGVSTSAGYHSNSGSSSSDETEAAKEIASTSSSDQSVT